MHHFKLPQILQTKSSINLFVSECGTCRVNAKKLTQNKFCKRDYGELLVRISFLYRFTLFMLWSSRASELHGLSKEKKIIESNNSFMNFSVLRSRNK